MREKDSLAFLLAAPYSGATLLSILVNQHPKISSDGEIYPYDIRGQKLECSCGKDQIDCDYYSKVASHMILADRKEWDPDLFYYVPRYSDFYYLSRAFEGFWSNPWTNRFRNMLCATIPAFSEIDTRFLKSQIELIQKSLAYRDASVYFDGSKSLRRAELFLEHGNTDKLVYLIRDGRAFCSSYLKNQALSSEELSVAAKAWLNNIRKVDELRRRFSRADVLVVRYEDLTDSVETELKRIFSFLGLAFDPSYIEYHKEDMHILGNRMRYTFSGVVRRDTKWKDRLSDDQVSKLNDMMERELRRFGYL